jgi:hypothetical protein
VRAREPAPVLERPAPEASREVPVPGPLQNPAEIALSAEASPSRVKRSVPANLLLKRLRRRQRRRLARLRSPLRVDKIGRHWREPEPAKTVERVRKSTAASVDIPVTTGAVGAGPQIATGRATWYEHPGRTASP